MRADPASGRGAAWQLVAVLFASTLLAGVAAYFGTALATSDGDDDRDATASTATTSLRPAAMYRVPPSASNGEAGGGYVILADETRPVRFSESGVGTGGADAASGPAGTPGSGGPATAAAGGGAPSGPTSAGGTGASGTEAGSASGSVATAAATARESSADGGLSTPAGAAGGAGRSGGRPAVTGRGVGPLGAILPVDPCVFGGAACPRGVLGRITGGPEAAEPDEVPAGIDRARLLGLRWFADYVGAIEDGTPEEAPGDVGRAAEALTAASIVRAVALITPGEVAGAADVPGCLGPSGDAASFVVGTVGRSGMSVYYWPVARSGDPLYSDVQHGDGVTDTLVDRPIGGPRYEGCARMTGLRPGLIYQARVRATAEDGSVEWSAIGDFCVAPCLPRFTAPVGVLTGVRIERHSSWAVAYLDAPPVGGALEFYIKPPGGPEWLRSTMRTNYLGGQPLPSLPLYPAFEYDYKLVLHGDDGRTYESVPARFTTLRRTVIAAASRFHVVRSGDSDAGELKNIQLYLNPVSAGLYCVIGPCRDDRDAGQIAVPLGGLVGDNPYDGETIDIETGTTIGVTPRFLVHVERTAERYFYVVTDAFEGGTLDVPQAGYLFWEVRIPPYVGTVARFGGIELGSVCDVPGAVFSPQADGAVMSVMEPTGGAPWLQPADLRICILEVE